MSIKKIPKHLLSIWKQFYKNHYTLIQTHRVTGMKISVYGYEEFYEADKRGRDNFDLYKYHIRRTSVKDFFSYELKKKHINKFFIK